MINQYNLRKGVAQATYLLLFFYPLWTLHFYTHFYKSMPTFISFAPLSLLGQMLFSLLPSGVALFLLFRHPYYRKTLKKGVLPLLLLLYLSLFLLEYQSLILGYSPISLRFFRFGPLLMVLPPMIFMGIPYYLALSKEPPSSFLHLIVAFLLLPLITLMILQYTLLVTYEPLAINWITLPLWHPYLLSPPLLMVGVTLILPHLAPLTASNMAHRKSTLVKEALIILIALLLFHLTISEIYQQLLTPTPLILNQPL